MDRLDEFLHKTFGYTSFKDNQRAIIESVLRNQDSFAMLATGAGKSLCYQLPALWKQGTAVIVSPLLSLMENQVQELKQAGIKRVAAYNSFLNKKEKNYILHHLSSYKIIYISPESLQQPEFSARLSGMKVSLLAVDEAHCISQWGHEFRTDYLKIKDIKRQAGNPPCLALTATAAEEVRADVIEKLELNSPKVVCESADRPNIALFVEKLENDKEKMEALKRYVMYFPLPGMIYVNSRHKAEELAAFMKRETSLMASAYHGGMTKEDRQLIQQQFLTDEIDVICCTNAFGMGINKPNIRFCIHFDYSKDIESFVQEIGRAGRDGKQSISLLLCGSRDGVFPRKLIDSEFPAEQKVQEICRSIEEGEIPPIQQLQHTYELEEVHARFLYYYCHKWQQTTENETCEDHITKVIKRRKAWKLKKLNQMEQWIKETDHCRRQSLLKAFDEAGTPSSEPCCDLCGHSVPYRDTQNRSSLNPPLSWKARLRSILHQSKESIKEENT